MRAGGGAGGLEELPEADTGYSRSSSWKQLICTAAEGVVALLG